MTHLGVYPTLRGVRAPAPAVDRAATPVGTMQRAPTFPAPVARPGEAVRDEAWRALSRDGLWSYDRQDDEGSTWTVTYRPTGQTRDLFCVLLDARRATASYLLAELRSQAYVAAFRGPAAGRRDGQRCLAVHMRLIGMDEADYRCRCGGILVEATRDGRLAHVDGCRECWTDRAGFRDEGPGEACAHRFCGAPEPVECGHNTGRICREQARPNNGTGCGGQQDIDCCTACCHGE